MNDDAWSRELARMARDEQEAERARLDDRWDRLSAGDLTAEEEAELRALAAQSEEGQAAYDAFRPLGPDFQARMVQALQAQAAATTTEAGAPAELGSTAARPSLRVLRFPRRSAVRVGAWTVAAAAAAALILMVQGANRPPALPGYNLELVAGNQEQRGEPGSPPAVLALGSPFDLVLRPDTAVAGELAVRGCLEGGGELRPWDVPLEIKGQGTVRITGTVGPETDLAPGDWTLRIAVGRPDELPDGPSACTEIAGAAGRGRDRVVLSRRIRVR